MEADVVRMRKSASKPSQRIHESFPPMGDINQAHLGSAYSPPVDQSNYQFAINRMPPQQAYGVLNSAQNG